MHGLVQKGLAADAQLQAQGRHPEGAAAGLELAVGAGLGRQGHLHPKAMALQSLHQGLHIHR
jgi:hypothetical protein